MAMFLEQIEVHAQLIVNVTYVFNINTHDTIQQITFDCLVVTLIFGIIQSILLKLKK